MASEYLGAGSKTVLYSGSTKGLAGQTCHREPGGQACFTVEMLSNRDQSVVISRSTS